MLPIDIGRRTQVVKGEVCKTSMQRFESARRLQPCTGMVVHPLLTGFGGSSQQTIQFSNRIKAPGLVVTADRMRIDKDLRYGSPGGQTLHFGSLCWVIGDVDFFKLNVL
jgi:hypothetical protein